MLKDYLCNCIRYRLTLAQINFSEDKLRRTLTALLIALSVSGASFAAGKILAKVNGKAITENDLQEVMKTLPPNYKTLESNPQFRKQILENMIKEELLYQQALKEGIDKDPEVQKEIEMMKKRIIVQALLRRHVKPEDVKVSDSEAKAFYEKNKERFKDANGKAVPFQTLKPFIVQSLKQQKEQEAFRKALDKYVADLEKHSKVEVYVK